MFQLLWEPEDSLSRVGDLTLRRLGTSGEDSSGNLVEAQIARMDLAEAIS